MGPGHVCRHAPRGGQPPRWRRASGSRRRRAGAGSTRRPAGPARRGRRTGARSRPGRGRPGRPTSGGSRASASPGPSSPRAARRRCVLASTSRTTASSRPSLDPKWYSSMRWLVPIASAMRRRLWSASPSAVKCVDDRVEEALPGSGRPAASCPPAPPAVGPAPVCPVMYQMVHSRDRHVEDGRTAMAQQVIDETATTGADPASVYALLADGSTWPQWSPLGSFELIEPGDGTPEGLGAVRLFTTGRHKSRERVVTCRPGQGLRLRARGRPAPAGLQGGGDADPDGTEARPSTGARPSGPRCPARAGSTAASWASSSRRTVAGLAAAADRARSS